MITFLGLLFGMFDFRTDINSLYVEDCLSGSKLYTKGTSVLLTYGVYLGERGGRTFKGTIHHPHITVLQPI